VTKLSEKTDLKVQLVP